MLNDIGTVMGKELRELLYAGGLLRGGRLSVVILLGVFGVLLPYQFGSEWLNAPGMLLYWAWVPLMVVSGVIADAFAGERERHTLETLLASRLPDRAILIGKAGAAVVYAWTLVQVMLALSVATVMLSDGERVVGWPWRVVIGAPILAWVGASAAAAAGVLISLRAPTARHAAQVLNVGILLLVFVPPLIIQSLPPGWQVMLALRLRLAGADVVVAGAAGFLACLALVLLALADRRFRRARLILD